ncbi:uncharacterized protein LOC116429309 [Nomia melanderi]|uniref:uncharacterized protein LOC116429309 n=1 Tax=Nomia melanderi TaxID=2448451 RepID=UPI0013042032|nr:uncharacterized protein LOC116429309 [Nomia melanderi]XP_031837961.1 uncharacterized protein LOC116429309 [Nomia melanderi]XP_031837962.1 uncharacterized protein LOC116429309 [Nomia melanderi]XP_031837963.1 uncharacterized protein LOC116429309 [Nomia melanderi]XP_031837964.1 uncharacterized protein LOC116429309 [Nomia melanderi]
MSMLKSKGYLFLASSLCDGLEDNDIKQVTTLLLNKEANPNTLIPTYGVTPFHLVIGNDSEAFAEEVTKLFLRHGGNPNVKSVDGLTPVHVAAAWGRITVLELLLANGGDALCLDYEGRSPFHYAFDGKYYGAIAVLSKYCENVTKEEKPIKYKITFDKLVVNDGDTIAEYVALLDTHIINQDILNVKECQTNEENRLSNNRDKYFYFSDNSLNDNDEYDINAAELRLREEMDREKCLLNQIINQLSSSLNSNSKETDINSEYKQVKDSRCDSSPLSVLNTDDSSIYDVKDKFSLKTRTKKRSVTPRYKRRIFGRNSNTKIPLIPLHDPSDSIISKSPNFLMGKTIEKDQRFSSPKVLSKESKFKTYTPCLTRNGSFRSDEFNFGKEMARSTPRRKHCYRQYSSHRKLKRNEVLTSSESTSPSSTNSLSPDEHHYPKLCYRFNKNFSKNLAVKLHENKYDDDMPVSPNFNEKKNCIGEYNVMKNLVDECSSNLESLKMKEAKDMERKRENLNVDSGLQEKYLEDLKANDTLNTFKENYNIFLSSFQSQSYVSIQEEYKYESLEENLAFVERRIYTLPPCKSEEDFSTSDKLWPNSFNLSTDICITNEELRRKLIKLGDNPGPVTNTTRQVYLKRFITLQKRTQLIKPDNRFISFKTYINTNDYNHEVKSSLAYGDWVNQLGRYKIIEKTVFKEFSDVDPSRKWRDGINKTSFNYLLLDPRITKDLPFHAESMTKSTIWTTFLSAIFYVGKGTRNRPHSHLNDALKMWTSSQKYCENEKVQRIMNIWNEGCGIICLQVFQNVIPVEAYTREAAMIDALGLKKLKNLKSGDYYGIAATWNIKEKCNFGRYLLYQAMQIFLLEGERHIYPQNL